MIGSTEILILIVVASFGGWCAIRGILRIREWWMYDQEATLYDRFNGYGAALVELVIGLFILATGASFVPGLLGFGNQGNAANNQPTAGPTKKGPDEILQQLVGSWQVVAEHDGKSQYVGSAIAIKLGAEPWVVSLLLDKNGSLFGITVYGFDTRTSAFIKCEIGIRTPAHQCVGDWVEKERAFEWRIEGDKEGLAAIDSIEDSKITHTSQSPTDEKAVSRIWFHRTKDPTWQDPEPSPLDRVEGRWSFQSISKVKGRDPIENSGTTILHRASGFPLHFELSFNEKSGRLADVYVIHCRGSQLTKRWFTSDGIPMEVSGELTPDKKGIDWSVSSAEGQFRISDRITSNDTFSSSFKVLTKADGVVNEALVERKRLK